MAIIGFIIFILVVIGICSNPYGNGGELTTILTKQNNPNITRFNIIGLSPCLAIWKPQQIQGDKST